MDTGTEEKRTRFVVVGGGFGGVYAALHLAQYDPEGYEIEVILVSDRNHFTFTPLLHDVLGGSLSGHHVAVPYRVLGERVGFRFVQARMDGLDRDRGAIETTVGPIDYDYLILALGARPAARVRGPRPAELGEDSVGPVVTPFHRIPDAVWMHDRVLDLAERCVRTDDEAERRRLLTFVVGGGGPAGVEAAGELLQLLHSVLPRYYDCLEGARVVLVHGDERILRGWDADLARRGQETLREAGLELHLETRLGEVTDQGVRISPEGGGEEQEIEAMTVIDATGNIPNSGCLEDSGLPLDDEGRIRVDEHLRVEGEARIFAVGDVNDL
ncbi:MAG TPA: FAD-dependent oxidoreductase, partial [Longimicrobiales bacterium]|nr:FAD-dependent oxidoreductase [Longimicrobiales bacterium]